jgi:lysylphosphatidylglycerol synthetase-like protein (DUF2156 family)
VYLTGLFIHEFPEAYFYHASEKYAALLHDLGYWINDVGAETTLQVRAGQEGTVCAVGSSRAQKQHSTAEQRTVQRHQELSTIQGAVQVPGAIICTAL